MNAASHVHGLSLLSELDEYQGLHAELTQLYQGDKVFRAQCNEAARDVVQRHTGRENLSAKAMATATRYLLAELPLYSHSDLIFDVPHSLQVHHSTSPFFEALYARELAWKPSPEQGFAVLEPWIA